MSAICKKIFEATSQFFPCEEKQTVTVLQTPFLYPDGDCISLYIEPESDGTLTVSDFGETARWLRSNTQAVKRTPKQNSIIQDICLTHNVEFINGVLQISRLQETDVPEVVFRIAQAAIRVSDIWLTFRNRTIQSTAEEVSEYFDEKSLNNYSRDKKEIGKSGRQWHIDFYFETTVKNSFISLLSTGSRQTAKNYVDRACACFMDIRSVHENDPRCLFVSLIDDTNDVWDDTDFKLLSQVSDVTFWSEPAGGLQSIFWDFLGDFPDIFLFAT